MLPASYIPVQRLEPRVELRTVIPAFGLEPGRHYSSIRKREI